MDITKSRPKTPTISGIFINGFQILITVISHISINNIYERICYVMQVLSILIFKTGCFFIRKERKPGSLPPVVWVCHGGTGADQRSCEWVLAWFFCKWGK